MRLSCNKGRRESRAYHFVTQETHKASFLTAALPDGRGRAGADGTDILISKAVAVGFVARLMLHSKG